MKKDIKIRVEDLHYNLEGFTIDEAIDFLKKEKKAYIPQYKELRLEIDFDYYDNDNSGKLALFGVREETEKEYETRLKKEKEQKDITDNYNRQMYEKLKKQFENQ